MPVRFPMDGRNRKAVREALLLDTVGSGVEDALVQAAERAAGPDQEVFVSRSYGPAGRVSVWIVDRTTGDVRERSAALTAALARVTL